MAMTVQGAKMRRLRHKMYYQNVQRCEQRLQYAFRGIITMLMFISVSALVCSCLITPASAVGISGDLYTDESQEDSTTGIPYETHPIAVIKPMDSVDPPLHDDKGCKASMGWPVLPHVVTNRFKAPKQIWAPGHRGVDVAAMEDTPLLAPADGFISFVGIVAGKSVVSIRHNSLTLTLEPAQTLLPIGTPVKKGLPIGVAKGLSDHCMGLCVHWGVRKGRTEYRDPQMLASKRKIVLKQPDGA
ncbi:murein DD-endopeptidase MepM/ murein hydrolase activator NlpD [Bifidobacterium commune]|nr:peptidoglycan DD-metalloendopeptidase family protein [Bifidobacterium commune]MBB2954776.1 murein DD-endopeptidase MepM/ murein hydrolase activator NlpD [Bifidobacterium commune]